MIYTPERSRRCLKTKCEKCKYYKLRDDGFPEFPENGGCPVLDAMEYARFNIDEFPKKDVVEEIDDDGDVVRWHYCKRFESIRVDLTRLHSIALDSHSIRVDLIRLERSNND